MPDKGISDIPYNFPNLPKHISQHANFTYNSYRADGVKIRKEFVLTNAAGTKTIETEYLEGFQYSTPNTEPIQRAMAEADDATLAARTAGEEEAFLSPERAIPDPGGPINADNIGLSFFPTAEGYYDYENFRYIYQYKDHLGNVRVSFVGTGTGTPYVVDRNDYYPFGMSFLKSQSGNSYYDPMAIPYNYKYNGKELQETGMYDYGWRNYAPDIARWIVPDPLLQDLDFTFNPDEADEDDEDDVEQATARSLAVGKGIFNPDNLNPYAYGYNDPVRFNDPDGKCPICVIFLLAGFGILDSPSQNVQNNQAAKQQMTNLRNEALLTSLSGGMGGSSRTGASAVLNAAKNQAQKQAQREVQNAISSSSKGRSKPADKGIPNSSKIDTSDKAGKTTKYSTYDRNGDLKKQVEADRGKPRHGIDGPTKKVPVYNTNKKTGETFRNGEKVKSAGKAETPPGDNSSGASSSGSTTNN